MVPAGLSTDDLIAYLAQLPVDERAQILAAMMAPPGIPAEASADVPPPPGIPVEATPDVPPPPGILVEASADVPPPPTSMRPQAMSAIELDLEVEVEEGAASVEPARMTPPPPPPSFSRPPPPASVSTLPAPPSAPRMSSAPIAPTPVIEVGINIPVEAQAPISTRGYQGPATSALDSIPPASNPFLTPSSTPFVPPPSFVPPPPASVAPPVSGIAPVMSGPAALSHSAPVFPAVEQPLPLTQAAPIPLTRPQSAVDVIDLLFDAMEDLPFLETALEASAFCLSAALRVLPSRAGMVHLYDINTREFITVYAQGDHTERLLMTRTPETDSLMSAALGKHRAIAFRYDRGGSPRDRHAFYGPPRSVLVAPATVDGRYLGIIELIDPVQGGVFDERAENAISYVADRFAEFLAQHGVGIGQIVPPPSTTSGILPSDDDSPSERLAV